MVSLTSNRYPSSRRTNLPTDRTERFMEDEDVADAELAPEEDSGSYPTIQWNRSRDPDEEFQHGPLYIHEKINPEALVQSVLKQGPGRQADMFAQFNGLPEQAHYEWYQHEGYWQNRMIHGDARRVMASLANREGLSRQVQMIYIDPPYNIKFSANFQLRTDQTTTKESGDEMPHDPASLKAFRDQYRGSIDTYLDNLHEQLILARSLLTTEGSCFVQIGPDNIHEIAMLMSEVFGKENHVATIPYSTGTNQSTRMLPEIGNWLVWFAKDKAKAKYNQLYEPLTRKEKIAHMSSYAMCEMADGSIRNLTADERDNPENLPSDARAFRRMRLDSAGASDTGRSEPFEWNGQIYQCPEGRHWSVSHEGLANLNGIGRLVAVEGGILSWKRYEEEIPGRYINAVWNDLGAPQDKRYIVQTPERVIERCILMTTDPGDLVLDPTCGGGTTAYLAERWGRRWITIDTSRVAIAVARQRLATSLHETYLLKDSGAGATREAELSGEPYVTPTGQEDVAKGFVYKRVPRVSAATLAYALKEFIYLVDQPEIVRRRLRVCSTFTVESDSPTRAIGVEEEIAASSSSPTREQILEALPITGVNYRAGEWQVSDLTEFPDSRTISHTATLTNRDSGDHLRAGIHIAPEDNSVAPGQIRRAAFEAANIAPRLDTLLVIAFEYEASTTDSEFDQLGRIRIIRAEANRDLTIPGLKNLPSDNAFVVVGEPDVDLRWTETGQLELEILGIDTYDPRRRTVTSGGPTDIYCFMTDTDYDDLSFKARRINFPNQSQDKQLKRMKEALSRELSEQEWERLLTVTTVPFDAPEGGKVAVRVIDRTAMETMRVIEVPERAI